MLLCLSCLKKKADYIIIVWHLWDGNVVMSNPIILKYTLLFYFTIINNKIKGKQIYLKRENERNIIFKNNINLMRSYTNNNNLLSRS